MRWMFNRRRLGALLALAASLQGAGAGEDRTTYGPTGPSDTLWSIAQSVRPPGATMEQTMLALVRLNPEGFVGPLDKLVKAGVTLRAPLAEEAQAIEADRARRIVAGDEGPWKAAIAAIAPVPAAAAASSARSPEQPALRSAPDAPALETAAVEAAPPADSAQVMQQRLDAALADAADARAQLEIRDAEVADAKARQAGAERALRQRERASPLTAFAESPQLLGGAGAAAFAVFLLGFLMGRAGRRAPPQRKIKPAPAAVPPTPRTRVQETSQRDRSDKLDAPAPPAAAPAPAAPTRVASKPPAPEDGEADALGYAAGTKLNMARAYARLGDDESARGVCAEVIAEGSASEQEAARALLNELDERRE